MPRLEEFSGDTSVREDSGRVSRREADVTAGVSVLLIHPGTNGEIEERRCDEASFPMIFGREMALGDGSMSKKHFALITDHGILYLRDLESRNGTFVNGHRAAPNADVPLSDGAVVRAGERVWMVRFGAALERGSGEATIPGIAAATARVRKQLLASATSEGPVLLLGETGTGKEYAARALHRLRNLPDERFIPVNCAELDPALARSELFGVERGAFTDAKSARSGLIAEADGGTLFLDELGELDLASQADLLRFLENGTYRAVGSTELRRSSARLVAATNVDLDAAVQGGRFRRDLLARWRAFVEPIVLPALSARAEDILIWFHRFLAELGEAVPRWTAGVSESLLVHGWPENLRELKMAARAARHALGLGVLIEVHHLPAKITESRSVARSEEAVAIPAPRSGPEPSRDEVMKVLAECRGVVRKAAQTLGVDRRKFYRLCQRHEIDLNNYRDAPED